MFKIKTVTHIAFVVFIYTCISLVVVPESQAAENPKNFAFEELNPALSLIDPTNLDNRNNGASATRRTKASLRKKLLKTNFRADEDIAVSFNNPGGDILQIQVLDNEKKAIDTNIDTQTTNNITTFAISNTNIIQPGKYRLLVTGIDGKMLEQDFTWGVLSINTNKSYYKPGEKAYLEFAVLNEQGNMVCDAKLNLQITNDELGVNDLLSSENGYIAINPECYSHDFTLKPDYGATYTVGDEGIYTMTLTAETRKGSYTITDSFIVDSTVPFDIERITATRIYPPHSYPVIFKITANENFEGVIKEAVPGSFSTSPFKMSTININRDTYADEIQTSEELTESSEIENPNTELEQPQLENDVGNASSSADTPVATSSAYSIQNDPLLGELKTFIGQTLISLEKPFTGSYRVTQHFGVQETDPLLLTQYLKYGVSGHDGIDFALPKGTPVLAADIGDIIFADNGDYGKTVVIQHAWGRSYYGHLDDIQVPVGHVVKQGDKLGLSGNTGLSTGPHLHFGMKLNDNNDHNGYFGKVDPLLYLNNDVTRAVAGISTTSTDTSGMMQVTSLEYPLKIKNGETIQIEYRYLAPPKSPDSYLLGPLQLFDKENNLVFEESRQWQIASDASWYSPNWEYRKALTIDRGKVDASGGVPHLNFPVLIVATADADLVNNAQADGDDILFTSSDGATKLSADKDATASAGTIRYWVQIPSLTNASDTLIYMYYGNPSSCDQTDVSCDASANSNTTWDSNYVGVYHMQQVPSTIVRQWDSSGNGHHMTHAGGSWSAGESVTSIIGNALDFDGTNDHLTHADDPAFDPTSDELTLSAWIRFDAAPSTDGNDDMWIAHYHPSSPWISWRAMVQTDNRLAWNWVNSGSTTDFDNSSTTITLNRYEYHTFSKIGTTGRLYHNGIDRSNTPIVLAGDGFNASGGLHIGSEDGASNVVNGVLDEVRLQNVGRSAGWIKTEWSNQNSPGAFYTWGPQECMVPPATAKLMRHGKYFDTCGRHAFYW